MKVTSITLTSVIGIIVDPKNGQHANIELMYRGTVIVHRKHRKSSANLIDNVVSPQN